MSGTSLDGVDAVLAEFDGGKPRLIAHASLAFDAALRRELLALNRPGANEIDRTAQAGNELAGKYAAAVAQVLPKSKTPAARGRAIGCHGPTARPRPERRHRTPIRNA